MEKSNELADDALAEATGGNGMTEAEKTMMEMEEARKRVAEARLKTLKPAAPENRTRMI